jgi:hypothetical protein
MGPNPPLDVLFHWMGRLANRSRAAECGKLYPAAALAAMPHRFDVHDVLMDLKGPPVVSGTEAINIHNR